MDWRPIARSVPPEPRLSRFAWSQVALASACVRSVAGARPQTHHPRRVVLPSYRRVFLHCDVKGTTCDQRKRCSAVSRPRGRNRQVLRSWFAGDLRTRPCNGRRLRIPVRPYPRLPSRQLAATGWPRRPSPSPSSSCSTCWTKPLHRPRPAPLPCQPPTSCPR